MGGFFPVSDTAETSDPIITTINNNTKTIRTTIKNLWSSLNDNHHSSTVPTLVNIAGFIVNIQQMPMCLHLTIEDSTSTIACRYYQEAFFDNIRF